MVRFLPNFLENFLGIVRKYMLIRGNLTQKDLADKTGVGISTMSRFLNLKTNNVDEQLVANVVAVLEIPLHEIIDWVEEDSEDVFKKLIKFYKENISDDKRIDVGPEDDKNFQASINVGTKKQTMHFSGTPTNTKNDLSIRDKLESLSPRQKAYLNDFLSLDGSDRDLIVDLGDSVFRYFRQRNIEF